MYFLSSVPRSGGTLLTRLLAQHPNLLTGPLSALVDVLGAMKVQYQMAPSKTGNIYVAMRKFIEGYYTPVAGKHYIDKSWTWCDPTVIDTMLKVLPEPPKIIATVRPIRECLASFIHLTKEDPVDFINKSPLAKTLFAAFHSLERGYTMHPHLFCLIEYDELVDDAQAACDKCTDFLGLPRHIYDLDNISGLQEDAEAVWGIRHLHDVSKTISRQSYNKEQVLGRGLWKYYDGGNFWRYEDIYKQHDTWYEIAHSGNIELGEEFAKNIDPRSPIDMFNAGYYSLRKGNLIDGMNKINQGYRMGMFGTPATSTMPQWHGETLFGKTVLLHLEGGYGDQISGLRYIRELKKLGADKVIVAGSMELACLLPRMDGAVTFIDSKYENAIQHDYFVPSMRCVPDFGFEYADIDGSPFLTRYSFPEKRSDKHIGIRWAGNPQFDEDHLRRVPPSVLFSIPGTLVSLQKDSYVQVPNRVITPQLNSWEDTARVIERLDMVVSSCTSVAHLAAALGVPTVIMVPVLPYYLWALPGDKTSWYNSVTLARQKVRGEWHNILGN